MRQLKNTTSFLFLNTWDFFKLNILQYNKKASNRIAQHFSLSHAVVFNKTNCLLKEIYAK